MYLAKDKHLVTSALKELINTIEGKEVKEYVLKCIQNIDTIIVKDIRTKKEKEVDNTLKRIIERYMSKIDHKVYTDTNEVLSAYNSGNILILTWDCYLLFDTINAYNSFWMIIYDQFKTPYDIGDLPHLNIYHIIPAHLKQKARLEYNSTDTNKLETLCANLATVTGESANDITTHPGLTNTKIIFHKKTGTYYQLCPFVYKCVNGLRKEYNDNNLEIATLCGREGLEYLMDKIITEDKSNTLNGNIINIINLSTVSGDIIESANSTNINKAEHKENSSATAKKWIKENPYKSKYTRGQYYSKYKDDMIDSSKPCVYIKKYADIMHKLGYTETQNRKIGKIWTKTSTPDSDIDNDSD